MKNFGGVIGCLTLFITVLTFSACVPKVGQPVDDQGKIGTVDVSVDVSVPGVGGVETTESTGINVFGEKKQVDVVESTVFRVGKKIGGAHSGAILLKEGFVLVSGGVLVGGSFTMDMDTITVLDIPATDPSNASLVRHLKNADFFDVENFPEANFVISSVKNEQSLITVTGMITIKGTTKTISFPVVMEQTEKGIVFRGDMMIDRTEFGIMYKSGKLLDTIKDKAIDDVFTLTFVVVAK